MITAAGHPAVVRAPQGRRRGITLMEMVVSLAITTVILTACGSIMLLAGRALRVSAAGPAARTAVGADAANRIAGDLRMATQIIDKTATSVTFTVPDRNGDSLPETLCYAWPGPGSPLTRQCNGWPVPAASIADNVQDFSLTYLDRTTGPPPALPPVELPEQVLISHDDAPGGSFQPCGLKARYWGAAYFAPPLPANAISWKITRVQFMAARSGGATGLMAAEIRTATAALKPSTTVLESFSVDVTTLPSDLYTRIEANYSTLTNLTPGVGLCLVMTCNRPAVSVWVQYESGGAPMTPNTHWMISSTLGNTWTDPDNVQDMRFHMYGTVTIQP